MTLSTASWIFFSFTLSVQVPRMFCSSAYFVHVIIGFLHAQVK